MRPNLRHGGGEPSETVDQTSKSPGARSSGISRFGPTPIAERDAAGVIRIGNLESPMAFAQRMERRKRMVLGYAR
jgi:hypothetical protein